MIRIFFCVIPSLRSADNPLNPIQNDWHSNTFPSNSALTTRYFFVEDDDTFYFVSPSALLPPPALVDPQPAVSVDSFFFSLESLPPESVLVFFFDTSPLFSEAASFL